jgi:aminoglycoside 6'-N-acetyltransferase I
MKEFVQSTFVHVDLKKDNLIGTHDSPVFTVRSASENDATRMAALDGDVENLTLLLLLSTTKAFVVEADTIIGWAMARKLSPTIESAQSLPEGWYLTGLVVHPTQRRNGIGTALTEARLNWLAGQTNVIRYFTERDNKASIALHRGLGFSVSRECLCKDTLTFGQGSCVLFEKYL